MFSFTCSFTWAGQCQVSVCVCGARGDWGIISGPCTPAAWLSKGNITLLIHPRAPESCTAIIKLLHCDSQCEEETCTTAMFPISHSNSYKTNNPPISAAVSEFRLWEQRSIGGAKASFSVHWCLHTKTHTHRPSGMTNLTHFPQECRLYA